MNSLRWCFFITLAIIAKSYCALVKIENGEIEGTRMISRKGEAYDAFLKIPFAEPPVGSLRFQPPVKKGAWSGISNATAYGPMCMQIPEKGATWKMSEDCLHLNVFTKNLGSVSLKPVILYLHGGGFEFGSALNHGSEYLMDRDVVLVTVNYRVAVFGFLATGTKNAIGNMGLKDQVMALEWVQENIKKFGGDPMKVTISGLSAGAYSVSLHILSDMSRNLFKRAILVSGAITWMSRMESDYLWLAQEIGKKVNCTLNEDLVECLQKVPADVLAKVDIKDKVPCGYTMVWLPVIESEFNQKKFLSRLPLEILKDHPEDRFKDIDIIAGMTEGEHNYAGPMFLSDPKLKEEINDELGELMYDCFYLNNVPKDLTHFRSLYFPYKIIDQRSNDGIGRFLSDGMIGYGSHRFVHYLSNFTNVYYYKLSYVGQHSVFNYPRDLPYGVTHTDDIYQFLFRTRYLNFTITETDRDNLIVERLTRIWEQFAHYGNPNNDTDEYLKEMKWPRHDCVDEFYLDIGTHMIEKHGLFLERFSAWDELNSGAKEKTSSLLILFLLSFIMQHFM